MTMHKHHLRETLKDETCADWSYDPHTKVALVILAGKPAEQFEPVVTALTNLSSAPNKTKARELAVRLFSEWLAKQQ
jgi:hypothetical protein